MVVIPELLKEVVLALAIGGLIGLERENEPHRKYAGIRTLALLCGIAPAVVAVSEAVGSAIFVGIYLTLAAVVSIGVLYIRLSIEEENIGFTTSIAVFAVAVLGVMVGYNLYFEATSIVILMALILAQKERLHSYVDKLSDAEISDALLLGMLVFILLPLLPNQPVGPYNVLNLREVLLLAIFVLLIEFVAYVSMRQVGSSKGMGITALLGGAASSLATAGVMAKIANEDNRLGKLASSTILLAALSMVVRNVVIASAIEFSVFELLIYPAVAMIWVAGMLAYLLGREHEPEGEIDIPMESPFSFTSAAKFAAAFMIISVAAKFAEQFLGSAGLYATAFAGGLVSSVAVATSAASLVSGGVSTYTAAGMVVVSIVASLFSKMVFIEAVNKDLRNYVWPTLAAVAVVGAMVFVLL